MADNKHSAIPPRAPQTPAVASVPERIAAAHYALARAFFELAEIDPAGRDDHIASAMKHRAMSNEIRMKVRGEWVAKQKRRLADEAAAGTKREE